MAEGGVQNRPICDWCLQDDKTVTATKFCVDCSNKLCLKCIKSHKKCKPFNNHKLRNIEESDSDIKAEELARNLQKCPNHPLEIVKYICKDHDDVCCNECAIVKHRKCDQLVLLSEECGNKKTSGNSTLNSLTELEEQTTILLLHEQDLQTAICESNDRAVSELREVKNEIDDAFKTLEQNVMSDIAQRTKTFQNECDNNRCEIEQLSTEIGSTKQNAELFADKEDPVLRYLFNRHQRKQTGKFHSKICELVEKTKTRTLQLVHLKPVSEICDMITESLKVDEVISTPNFSFRQIAASDSVPEDRDFTHRNAKLEYEAVIDNNLPSTVTSCVWVGKNVIIIVKRLANPFFLLLFNIDKRAVVHGLKCDYGTCSLTAIDDKRIAVCYGTNYVDIISVQQGLLVFQKRIKAPRDVYAISMDKISNELICLSSGGFEFVSLKNLASRTVRLDSIAEYETSEDPVSLVYDSSARLIHVSIYDANKVISIGMSGHKLNELVSDQHVVINCPHCITVDSDSNVYIVNNDGKTVEQCDKHLQYIRSILTHEDGAQCLVFNDDFTKFGLVSVMSDFTIKFRVFSFD